MANPYPAYPRGMDASRTVNEDKHFQWLYKRFEELNGRVPDGTEFAALVALWCWEER